MSSSDRAKARARSTDPATSSAAARSAESSGAASDQRRLCLAEVQRKPGQTAAEIALMVGLERHAPSRRLPELRAAGLVVNGAPRTCRVVGRASLTWWPASKQWTGVQRTLFG